MAPRTRGQKPRTDSKIPLDAIRRRETGESWNALAREYGVSVPALQRFVKKWSERSTPPEGQPGE